MYIRTGTHWCTIRYTQVNTGVHPGTQVHTGAYPDTQVHTGVHPDTQSHTGAYPDTQVHLKCDTSKNHLFSVPYKLH